MFIEVVRSGGIAGSTRRARVDVDEISDQASFHEWRDLVERAWPLITSQHAATSRQRTVGAESPVRDGFVWTVSVDDATCEVDDRSITGPLRDLAQRTLREGRPI